MVDPKQIERSSQKSGLTVQMVSEMTGYSLAEMALISKTVAIDAPLHELAVFLHAARQLRLDPLIRQCYWIRRKSGDGTSKGTLQVGIDGFRAIADRTGLYAGSEPPVFRGQLQLTKELAVPEMASVMVWRIVAGHKAAFTGVAHWREFYPGDGADGRMWRKMPHRMLGKAAEAEALRKGFPAQLASLELQADTEYAIVAEDLPLANPPRLQEEPRAAPTATAEDYDRIYGGLDEQVAEAPPTQSPEAEGPEVEDTARTALWVALAELIAEAKRLKIRTPNVPQAATNEQLAAVNKELKRLINAELDRQATREPTDE